MEDQFILQNLCRKLGILDNMQMTSDEIKKSFTSEELDLIEKAKYIRREGTKGNYKYIYEEPKGKQVKDESFKEYLNKEDFNIGDSVKLKNEPYQSSYSGAEGKSLKIVDKKEVEFASGKQIKFIVEDEKGNKYEIKSGYLHK